MTDIRTKYVNKINDVLWETYSTDSGKTFIKGQSLSHVIMMLRDNGLRVPAHLGPQENLLNELGFKLVRARGQRLYAGGKTGLGVECECVTVK